jgi:hypothetical protein
MANVKISALPSWTGSSADLRWFVMNNSGETETFKFSGYPTSITYGTGTNSIKSINATGASGTRAIAIGVGASATGDDSVCIGDISGYNAGTKSISIGKHGQVFGDYVVAIGSGTYLSGNGSIAIGHETAAYNGGIVLGGNTSRATEPGSITIGNNNERNIGSYSYILGYGNKIADAPNYSVGPYNVLIGTNCLINPTSNLYGYNTIFGGYGNTITGTTSGVTLINTNNITSAGSNDVIIGNGNTLGAAVSYNNMIGGISNYLDATSYSQILNGSGNTINGENASVERFNTIINGSNNTIFNASNEQSYQSLIGSKDTTISVGAERVTGIGLSGRTLSDQLAGTTVVENLFAYKQIASGFYDNGTIPAGGYTIDLRNGDKQQITISGSGSTSLSYIGNIAGGRLVLKVINTSIGTIGFADNSPYVWRIPALGIAPTANGTDVYIFESFGNQDLWFASQSKDLS